MFDWDGRVLSFVTLPDAVVTSRQLGPDHNRLASAKRNEFMLARQFGCTRYELRNRLSREEYLDWLAFYESERLKDG